MDKILEWSSWMLHEHGEEILNVILDVKYGTNYSGYNNNQLLNIVVD